MKPNRRAARRTVEDARHKALWYDTSFELKRRFLDFAGTLESHPEWSEFESMFLERLAAIDADLALVGFEDSQTRVIRLRTRKQCRVMHQFLTDFIQRFFNDYFISESSGA